jgi:hypothetical protein
MTKIIATGIIHTAADEPPSDVVGVELSTRNGYKHLLILVHTTLIPFTTFALSVEPDFSDSSVVVLV